MNALPLGAALYVPATHPDLSAVVHNAKLSFVRSVIVCTEDAIAAHELDQALAALFEVLDGCEGVQLRQQCFFRPRNVQVFDQVMAHPNALRCFAGVVIPKFTPHNLQEWLDRVPSLRSFGIMPTLETVEVFDRGAMVQLAEQLLGHARYQQVLALRIGGNDLLALLGMRRPRGVTVYETVLGQVVADLVTTFVPYGLQLTAPVFEYLDDAETLAREVVSDMHHGLVGKTAIHPKQIEQIEQHYAVTHEALQAAQAILAPEASGVFRLDGAMCEPATHRAWAQRVVLAAEVFGVRE